jgi:hypothetical protein
MPVERAPAFGSSAGTDEVVAEHDPEKQEESYRVEPEGRVSNLPSRWPRIPRS